MLIPTPLSRTGLMCIYGSVLLILASAVGLVASACGETPFEASATGVGTLVVTFGLTAWGVSRVNPEDLK